MTSDTESRIIKPSNGNNQPTTDTTMTKINQQTLTSLLEKNYIFDDMARQRAQKVMSKHEGETMNAATAKAWISRNSIEAGIARMTLVPADRLAIVAQAVNTVGGEIWAVKKVWGFASTYKRGTWQTEYVVEFYSEAHQ